MPLVPLSRDITGDIGERYPSPPARIPMFSYSRPAWILWQSVFDGMIQAGKTEDEAFAWLQSKNPRLLLDAELGDRLRLIGLEIGKSVKD
jgi:hypothetical protein